MRQVDTLRDQLAVVVTSLGYEFVGCELQRQGRDSLLRIYIDNEKGITLQDCTIVSRQVSAVLDVEDPIQERYTLEVSSPGLERPLFEMAHYEKFVGHSVKLRLLAPVRGRRNVVGVLLRAEGNTITVLADDEELAIAFSDIEKAKLVFRGD